MDKNEPEDIGGDVESNLLSRIDHEHGTSAFVLDPALCCGRHLTSHSWRTVRMKTNRPLADT
jgi:hypothetical protein